MVEVRLRVNILAARGERHAAADRRSPQTARGLREAYASPLPARARATILAFDERVVFAQS